MMRVVDKIASLLLLFAIYIFDKSDAGGYCDYRDTSSEYCEFGCCNDYCCDGEISEDDDTSLIAIILGLVLGIGGIIVIVVVIICICRRRRYRGFVYRQQVPPTPTVIVAHSQGMVAPTNVPSAIGRGANPYYAGGPQPPYGAYPQPQPMPQPYPKPQVYAQ